ncbi:lipoprotein release complex - ATP binding subunit [Desulfovibrionales bacterium]
MVDASCLYALEDVGKEVSGPSEKLIILRRINLTVDVGESIAVLGASGSGKTTFLHLLGSLDSVSWGKLYFRGRDASSLSEAERARIRNRDIGFVFQFHHLLPEFSTVENAAMPGLIAGMTRDKALHLATEVLALVGLSHRLEHRVTTLSGGERQRAAIARAILMRPSVLLADEPTGNLDEVNGELVGELLVRLNYELSTTLIVVTHNYALARRLKRRLELRSGELYA